MLNNQLQMEKWLNTAKTLSWTRLDKETSCLDLFVNNIRFYNTQTEPDIWVNYQPAPHRHSFFEMHLVLSGLQTYSIDGKLYPVEAGHLLLIPPGTLHAIPYYTATVCKFAISFSKSGNQSAYEWVWRNLENAGPLYLQDTRPFINLFELIMDIAGQGGKGWEKRVFQLCGILVQQLAQSVRPVSAVSVKKEAALRIDYLEQFIRDNIDAPINAEMLANYMHISIRQLNRDLQRECNMTTRTLVEKIKIEAATNLLKSTSRSIADIAMSLGFPDESTFSRFFKRAQGEPPGKWRSRETASS